MTENNANPIATTLRQRAEAKFSAGETLAQADAGQALENARLVLHELQVHQIELELQNEELRQTQAELEESRARYFDLYNLAPVGYVTLSEHGLILEANLTAAGLLGVARGALVTQLLTRFILPEDQNLYYRHRQQLFETGAPQGYELRMARQDGSQFWARVEATAAQGAAGAPVCRAVISDLTALKQAEEAQLKAYQQTHAILESISDAFFSLDLQLRVTYFNAAAEQALGRKRGDVLGRPLFEAFPEARGSIFDEHYTRALQEQAPRHFETYFGIPPYANWYEVRVYPYAGGLSVYFQVITERKQAEEALRASEAQYRLSESELKAAQAVARIGNWKWNLPKGEITWSDEMYRIFGIDKTSYTGRLGDVIAQVVHPDDLHLVLPANARGFVEDKPIEYRVILPDKSIRHIWARAGETVLDTDGHPIFLTGIAQDITERKQAEEALRQANEQLGLAQRSAGAGLWDWDIPAGQLHWSPELFRLFGLDSGGTPTFDVWRGVLHPDDQQQAGERINAAIQDRAPLINEYRIVLPSGEVRWISALGDTTYDERGEARRMAGICLDITARKQAEEALRRLNAELEQRVADRTAELSARTAELQLANLELVRTSRLKDEFLANMSHELRTPLTAILGLAEALQLGVYGPLSDRQAQMLQTIHQSGQHLLALITEILDLARIEAGKMELEFAPTPVADICQASLQFVKQTAQKKHLHLTFVDASQVGLLQADARRLKQMLVNLLHNAVKFTPEGGQVELRVTSDPARSDVHFTVSDTGIGIPPEKLVLLFQPFVQVDGSLSRNYEGTGLGLMLTRRLAEMHGGRVTVESAGTDQGSRFILSLPWQPVEPPALLPDKDTSAPLRLTLLTGHPPLILVADDNAVSRMVFSDLLQSLSARVVTASDGAEALTQALATPPDLILMDIQMPGLNGLEAIRQLKAAPATAQTPIIALTALVMPGDRERCLAAGANDYLSKPVGLAELGGAVARQLKLTTEEGVTLAGSKL